MSLALFFALTLAPFLSAWLVAEGVRQIAEARKHSRELPKLYRHGVRK